MPQFPVIGYQMMVSTNPPATPGAPAAEFVPRINITIQVGATAQQFRVIQLVVNSAAEYTALCALIQVPGRLIFDPDQQTLEKVMP